MIMWSQVRTCLVTSFENPDFVRNLLFSLLKNSVDEQGHRRRVGSPVTNFPRASPRCASCRNVVMIKKRTTDKRLANAIVYKK